MRPPDPRTVRAFLEEAHITSSRRVADFATEEIAPLAEPADDAAARDQAREILGKLGRSGWLEAIETQDFRACCLIRESLAAASPLADAVFALQALGTMPLLLAGGPELRDRWVEPAIRGEAMAAFAMTEPEAGSDVLAMKTRALADGDGYLLTGTKTLISNAGIADFYTIFARVDPAGGSGGIGCFVVPANMDGLIFTGPLLLSSPHPLGEIRLEECRVPGSARIGDETEGYKLGLATLDRLRPTVGAAACGMAHRALEEALAHAIERRQFDRPLADFQLIQEKLGRMATDLAAARLLVYRAAWERARGADRTPAESAMAKAFATEAAQRIVDDAVQILGGRGVLADHPVDRLYRSVRALRIYEGTTEIQRLIVAGQLIERAREGRDPSP